MTAEWDDLARLAEAATPGPWHVHEMGKVFVGNGAPGSLWQIVHMSGDDLTDLTEEGAQEARRNAAWIAAANPATILRLIRELQIAERASQANANAHMYAERKANALAARLAAVEALADEWERSGGTYPAAWTYLLDAAERLRAALSAAPTDTTKEN